MISFLDSFILLLVIMEPILSTSAFLSLAKDKSAAESKQIIKKAFIVAAFVFFLFAFGGDLIFLLLGVDINSFKAAGGIILMILGVQLALGVSFQRKEENISDIAVIIGTPLISGPATITTTIILVKDVGLATTVLAGSASLIVMLLFLIFAERLHEIVGKGTLQVISTMMGIITIAWGIQFLLNGITGFF